MTTTYLNHGCNLVRRLLVTDDALAFSQSQQFDGVEPISTGINGEELWVPEKEHKEINARILLKNN